MLFAPRLVDEAIVSIQNAVVISDVSEPDVTLLKFREDFYAGVKPKHKMFYY